MADLRVTKTCVWCNPPHVIEAGDPGAPTSHGMCAEAEAREYARMTLPAQAQDVAALLITGRWEDAPNAARIAALALAERALLDARTIGL